MTYNLFVHESGNIISIKIMQYSISTFFQTITFCMIIVRWFTLEKMQLFNQVSNLQKNAKNK